MTRPGKTQRMVEYAVAAGRQGREIAVIALDDGHEAELYKRLQAEARKEGCAWVVGPPTQGAAKNVEVYHIDRPCVIETAPGALTVRSSRAREVVVDHSVLEARYPQIIDHYARWL